MDFEEPGFRHCVFDTAGDVLGCGDGGRDYGGGRLGRVVRDAAAEGGVDGEGEATAGGGVCCREGGRVYAAEG